MNTRTIAALLLGGLVVGLASLALAGVEPSPFHKLINRLDSVENVLDAVDDRLSEILHPPTPIHPPTPVKLVGKLNAMADKLWKQNDRVGDVLDDWPPITPPDDEAAFRAALNKVGSIASSIAERASVLPDPYTPELEEALAGVGTAAQAIIDTVESYDPGGPLG
jgi:hypothetical protein